MNWFTKNIVYSKSLQARKDLIEAWGGCEHCEEDPSKVYAVFYENDPWGREGHCLCESCYDKAIEEEGEEILTCHDCGAEHPKKEMRIWRWYDFYAAQGDEPIIVCPKCRVAEKHIQRVRKDEADMNDELDRYYGYED